MKKLLCLLGAVLVTLTFCSNNDCDPLKTPSALLKKISYPKPNGTVYSETVAYDGNKIVSVTGDYFMIKYTYSGGFIAKSEEFDENDQLVYTDEYIYTDGKLAGIVEKDADSANSYETKYLYNGDGTVSYEEFAVVPGNELKSVNKGKYTFRDGNLIKDEGADFVILYEYDNKNHPYKNVLGYNLLLGDGAASRNNVIKETRSSGSRAKVNKSVITSVYKYNSNNFPTERVQSLLSGSSASSETIQYAY
ncbi:hypothetical protein [Flavobacterium humidisoli]|uniref:YD repeat-containing protein n=1 Tax=Flavobacterium humidisoli TaxID=2937442 RepID=A0ABY4LZC9_9FLAO|nr:hypothetical protein [Flavobacterium humidisoli]UPZ17898.1 hypothetical protein M0M44_11230 [Flavobacterium humidisoli]